MKKIYEGKTKDVLENNDGSLTLIFKDDVTGEGDRVDPGSNEIIGQVEGKGNASLRLSKYFFELLAKHTIPTHFLDANLKNNSMQVKKAQSFNLETICREKAWGSFIRRYGNYIEEGTPLNSLVEITLKDDQRGDPPLCDDTLIALGIMNNSEITEIKQLTKKITTIIKKDLETRNLELIDIKFEFGKIGQQLILIDEISGDGMRVRKKGRILLQKELTELVVG